MPLDKIVKVVGKSLLVDRFKPAYLDLGSLNRDGVFLKVIGDDVTEAHEPLVYAQVLQDITYEEAFDSIVDTEKMQAALRFLYRHFESRDNKRTMLSYLIITGLWELDNNGTLELPSLNVDRETLENKLIEQNGFSDNELSNMKNIVSQFVTSRHPSTIDRWVRGKTVAPIEMNYAFGVFENSALRQLAAINQEFTLWEQSLGRFDSRDLPLDVRSSYWVYRDLVSLIVGYLNSGIEKFENLKNYTIPAQAPERERRRPVQIHYAPEIGGIVRYFIGRRTEKYASPRVLDTASIDATADIPNGEELAQIGGARRPNPRLSRGIVTDIPDNFEGKVITITDLTSEIEAVRESVFGVILDYIEHHKDRYKHLYENIFRPIQTTGQFHVTSLNNIISDILVEYDPNNPNNARFSGHIGLVVNRKEDKLSQESMEFSKEFIENVISSELDKHYGTGSQIKTAVSILVKMRDALPDIVHRYLERSGTTFEQTREIMEEIKRRYGVEMTNNKIMSAPNTKIMFGEMMIQRISLGMEVPDKNGYGVSAYNNLLSPSYRDILPNYKLKYQEAGANFLSKFEVTNILNAYGIPDLMRFISPINFPDTLGYILSKRLNR